MHFTIHKNECVSAQPPTPGGDGAFPYAFQIKCERPVTWRGAPAALMGSTPLAGRRLRVAVRDRVTG